MPAGHTVQLEPPVPGTQTQAAALAEPDGDVFLNPQAWQAAIEPPADQKPMEQRVQLPPPAHSNQTSNHMLAS